MADETSPWTTLSSRRLHETRACAFDVDRIRHRSGREHEAVAIRVWEHGVAVAPIDEAGHVTLVGQYRYVYARFTWEVVRGSIRVGSTPLDGARAELREETGFTAARWLEVARHHPAPWRNDESVPCFVAWDLTAGTPDPDDTEILTCRTLPFPDAVRAALSGELVDSLSVALLLTLNERLSRGDLPEDLARRLSGRGG